MHREVLHGVGADGVGVKFPIFAVNCSHLPLSSRRVREKRRTAKKNEENKNEEAKKTSDPIYANSIKNLANALEGLIVHRAELLV